MNVVFLNQYFPPDLAPTGRMMAQLARYVAGQGHAVTIICGGAAYSGAVPETAAPSEPEAGVKVVRLRTPGADRRLKIAKVLDYGVFFVRAVASLWALNPRPDVVVAMTTPPYLGLVPRLAAGRAARIIHWIMDLYPDVMAAHGMVRRGGFRWRFFSALNRFMFRRAAAIWTLGPFMTRRVEKYLLSPRPCPIEEFPPWSEPFDPPSAADVEAFRTAYRTADRICVMYSGNMGLGHEFETILQAAARLQNRPDIRFAFVGGGPRRAEVERRIGELELPNAAMFPYVSAENLAASLAAGDIHLISLRPEWQGAMVPSKLAGIFAAGRPAILVGGEENELAQWLRESACGAVTPIDDVSSLASILAHWAADPPRRAEMGARAARYGREGFSPSCRLPAMLDSLIENSKSAPA